MLRLEDSGPSYSVTHCQPVWLQEVAARSPAVCQYECDITPGTSGVFCSCRAAFSVALSVQKLEALVIEFIGTCLQYTPYLLRYLLTYLLWNAALDWRLQLTKEILDSRSLCTARQVGAFITADSGHVTAGLEDLACLRYGSDIVISTPNRNAPAARPLYICFQSIADRMKGMCRR